MAVKPDCISPKAIAEILKYPVVGIAGHPDDPGLGWHEELNPLDPIFSLPQKDDVSEVFTFGGTDFAICQKVADCYSVIQTLYRSQGSQGVADFFVQNKMGKPDPYKWQQDGGTSMPEEFSARETITRMLDQCWRIIEKNAQQAQITIEKKAAEVAQARLASALEEIISESKAYFPTLRNAAQLGPVLQLKPGEGQGGIFLDTESDHARELFRELEYLQTFIAAIREKRQAYDKIFIPRFIDEKRKRMPFAGAMAQDALNPIIDKELFEQLSKDPQLLPLRMSYEEACNNLHSYVAVTALEFPILWQIYTIEKYNNPEAVRTAMLTALQQAHASNLEITNNLRDDPENVWKYRSAIVEALSELNVPSLSIARTAAEERMAQGSGMRLSGILSLTSGFTSMGFSLITRAALGTTPLGWAILAADVLCNIYDAIAEYKQYRTENAAFKACLDPAKSLGAEPNLFSAMLTIAFDLLAITQIKVKP